jgi:outer membrane protein TolC
VVNIGDFVNPAYEALNQLVGRPAFPTDIDARLPLAQETRLRVVQPLYNPSIAANHALARAARRGDEAAVGAAARRLAADIRTAYLDYARAERVVELYESTLPVVAENLRANERLVSNGRATPDAVLRARAERAEVEQQILVASERRDAARRAFNFLLERELDADIELVPDSALGAALTRTEGVTYEQTLASARQAREELRQVDAGADAARLQGRLARAAFLPSVAAAVDYGVQGNEYRFSRDRDFAIASLSLQWNLFNGGQDAARREQASLDTRRAELERQIALEVRQAYEGARVARQAIETADARLTSAERSFRLVARRYAEGLAPLVEFLDARNAFTGAGLNRILTTYEYWARRVELERAGALYDVPLPTATR